MGGCIGGWEVGIGCEGNIANGWSFNKALGRNGQTFGSQPSNFKSSRAFKTVGLSKKR